jgi:hypothetical protein
MKKTGAQRWMKFVANESLFRRNQVLHSHLFSSFNYASCASAASHSRDSIKPKMSIMDQRRFVTPAAIAGVQQIVW